MIKLITVQTQLLFGFRIVRRRVKRRSVATRKKNTKEYEDHKETARALIHQRLEHFNEFYKLPYKDVRIKNMKTRWGSCSSKGNLNFSYKLAILPKDLLDYIVVHELCHVKEMNHGPEFWSLVEKTVPDYKKRRNSLKHDYLL
jgi:predicted metal-dependent hydrolase